jgi:outer membrane immunogenic protein
MRKFLVALAFLCSSSLYTACFAGDWTGFYIGAHGGSLTSETDYLNPTTPAQDLDGAVFGGQVGYNFQTGNVVFGVETDVSFGSIDDSVKDGNFLGFNGDLEAFGTIRGRLGYAFGDFLPYVTAGVAWARLEQGSTCPVAAAFGACVFFPMGFDVKSTETLWGWTAGGGVEWAIDKSWSLKAEALFGDLDGEVYTATLPVVGPTSAPADLDFDSRLTVGVNYHF